MPGEPASDRRRAALWVWLQLLALLAAVGLFGWIILQLTVSLR